MKECCEILSSRCDMVRSLHYTQEPTAAVTVTAQDLHKNGSSFRRALRRCSWGSLMISGPKSRRGIVGEKMILAGERESGMRDDNAQIQSMYMSDFTWDACT